MRLKPITISILLLIFSCKIEDTNVSRFTDKDKNFNKARQYYIEKNYKKSIEFLNKSKTRTDIYYYIKAKCYLFLEKYKKAIENFKKIPDDSLIKTYKYLYLGEAYFKAGKKDKAIKILKNIDSKEKIHKAKAYFLFGQIYKEKEYNKATKSLENFVNQYNKLRYNWRIKQLFLGKNVKEKCYMDLIALYEKKKDYTDLLSLSIKILENRFTKKSKKRVLAKLKIYLKSGKIVIKDIKDLFIVAREFYYAGFNLTAEQLFKKLILQDKSHKTKYKLKSYYFLALINKKDYSKAMEFLKNGVIIYNSSPDSLYYLAKGYILFGEYNSALKLLKRILIKGKEDIKIRAYLTLINMYKKLKDKQKEEKIIKEFFKNFYKEKDACEKLYNLALLYYMKADLNKAKELFNLLLKGRYFKNMALFFIGEINFRQNNFKKSSIYLEKYLKTDKLNYFSLEAIEMLKKISSRKIEINKKEKLSKSLIKTILFGKSSKKYRNTKDFKLMKLFLKNGLSLEGNIHLRNIELKYRKEKTSLYKFLLNWFVKNNFVHYSLKYRLRLINRLNLTKYLLDFPCKYRQFIFPKHYYYQIKEIIKKYKIEEPLVFALIREESMFNIEAFSPANAEGLFQIIPPTANFIIKKAEIKMHHLTIYNVFKNAEIGLWYLNTLHKRYNNDYILLIAAYNAGEYRVDKWIKKYNYNNQNRYGFIELIPFKETKNYVKKVLFSYNFYKCR